MNSGAPIFPLVTFHAASPVSVDLLTFISSDFQIVAYMVKLPEEISPPTSTERTYQSARSGNVNNLSGEGIPDASNFRVQSSKGVEGVPSVVQKGVPLLSRPTNTENRLDACPGQLSFNVCLNSPVDASIIAKLYLALLR